MGAAKGQSALTMIWIGLFFAAFVAIPVQAQAGNVLVDEVSFGLANMSSFEGEVLSFTFEVHELAGNNANVSVAFVVQTTEGIVVNNSSLTLPELIGYQQLNVSANLSDLPYGYSQLTVMLLGDVGVNSTGYSSSISRTVQRLRPLNISLGGQSSVTVQGLNQAGESTGNLSLHDGDYAQFDFPLINHGDVNWTGDVTFLIQMGEYNESILLSDVSVAGSEATSLSVRPTLRLSEGEISWSVTILTNGSNAEGIHSLSGQFLILPPPLSLLLTSISTNVEEIRAGDTLEIAIVVWNNGSAPFSGSFICSSDDIEVYNSTLNLVQGTSSSLNFTMTAKPSLLICDGFGTRMDEQSTLPLQHVIAMESAIFSVAGAPQPSYFGGPWHKGDYLRANLLVRNTGELDGSIRLVLVSNGQTHQGDWIVLKGGAAGEIQSEFQFLTVGDVAVSWRIETQDGLIEGEQSGNTIFSVQAQQSVTMSLSEVSRSADGDVAFTVQLQLDEGRSRRVYLQVGYESSGATMYLREQELQLQEGLYQEQLNFGNLEADRLIVHVTAIDWSIGPGPLTISTSIPIGQTLYWIEFEATTTPLRPVLQDETKVSLTLHQSGQLASTPAEVWIVDAYGTILAHTSSIAWNGEDSVRVEFDILWPRGSTVSLRAISHIGDQIITEDISYVSGEVVVESSFEWPIAAIIWGIVLGATLILVARIKYRKTASSSQKGKGAKPQSNEQSMSRLKDEKREVACPECSRRLRVPTTYSGRVGCPDCATKFEVAAVEEEELEVEVHDDAPLDEPTAVTEPKRQEATAQSGKLEISCPDCCQTLRIPSSYTGSVRCPACTKIFKATEGFTEIE